MSTHRYIVILAALAFASAAVAGDPKYEIDRIADVQAAIDRYNEVSAYALPPLEDDHWRDLLEGEVVRLQWKQAVPGEENEEGEEEPRERRRVVALRLVDEPMIKVWVSALDPHFLGNDKLTEVRLEGDGEGGSTWYQFIDLPWPVRNRHWVIRVEKEAEIAAATNDRAWEQSWNLVDGGKKIAFEVVGQGLAEGIDLGEAEDARYLEANTGAWGMMEVDENLSLLTYQVTVVLGGWIPDRLAARFASGALKDLLNTVAENAHGIDEHYDADHPVVYGGDGRPVPKMSEVSGVTTAKHDDES